MKWLIALLKKRNDTLQRRLYEVSNAIKGKWVDFMKLSLTVEGKEQDVCAAYFREGKINCVSVIDENGVIVTYHDTKEKMDYYIEKPLQIDFDTCLKWQDRYVDVVELIRKRIDAKEERVIELAQEFIATYLDEELAFPEVEVKALKCEYKQVQASLNGLYESLNIVHELEGV